MSTESAHSTVAEKKNYKATLNLPQTAFPMEAKLVTNEPVRLQQWKDERLYEKLMTARANSPAGKWVLHDGPPFANGDIHIGHLINKTLKDVFMRYKSMRGFQTPYVPGWDCHGLPIEHKIQGDLKKQGKDYRTMTPVEVRKLCYESAEHFAKAQSEQFQRLGILGEWNDPYLTMKPTYEASTLEVFARFVEAGLVYKQLKPVHWSIANQTALADAELEYQDKEDQSVFVEFPVANPGAFKGQFDLKLNAKVAFLIWTTTPWTLPANMAIAVHPDVEYAFVKYKRNDDWHVSVVATDLVEKVFAKNAGATERSVVNTVAGKELVGQEYTHVFLDRVGKIVHAEYVTTTDGTGLVHTAPGHGEDDYHTGINNGIEIYCPVLANGRYDSTVPGWLTGLTVWEGNGKVVEKLKEVGALFAEETIRHSYPHDWRSKTPTIFRATEQWFVCIDKEFVPPGTTGGPPVIPSSTKENQITGEPPVVRAQTLRARASIAAESAVSFVPEWGRARLQGMLQNRPDWCISRQRAWGLPIPVFYNEKNEPLLTPASVRAVAKRFAEKGSDAWFLESPAELLGSDFVYPPGFDRENLRKEKDIFDVWFESGSSWHAVLQARSYLKFPADLYLEGSDQHRGWFQLSLLPALGATGLPPFKQVLTHGFVVKPDGTKVSKSDKEYVTATQEINKHGADLLRLWCCSVDYQNDIPASPKALQEFGDKYRKIRNTLRYLLSNLYDFDPSTDAVEIPAASLDGWAVAELGKLITETAAAFDAYQTHRAFRLLYDFCSVQISSVYGNAMKDRLYCEAPNAPLRRRSQTVMYRMALALTKMLAPMIVFTADEAWNHIVHKPAGDRDLFSVHLALWPEANAPTVDAETWRTLFELRDAALLQLDGLKKSAGLNKALDAEVVYNVPAALRAKLEPYGADLEDLVGAGFHSFREAGTPGVTVIDRRNDYPACARSWKRRPDVGSDPAYPDLCARDAAAVKGR
jgi:isoleucyl-tRNA synthetase